MSGNQDALQRLLAMTAGHKTGKQPTTGQKVDKVIHKPQEKKADLHLRFEQVFGKEAEAAKPPMSLSSITKPSPPSGISFKVSQDEVDQLLVQTHAEVNLEKRAHDRLRDDEESLQRRYKALLGVVTTDNHNNGTDDNKSTADK